MIQELHDFEENAFYEYNHSLQISHKEKMEEKVAFTSNKLVKSISLDLTSEITTSDVNIYFFVF